MLDTLAPSHVFHGRRTAVSLWCVFAAVLTFSRVSLTSHAIVQTGGQDDLCTIYAPNEQQLVARCEGHSSWVTGVAWDPWRSDERTTRFASVGEDCKLILWDLSSAALMRPKSHVREEADIDSIECEAYAISRSFAGTPSISSTTISLLDTGFGVPPPSLPYSSLQPRSRTRVPPFATTRRRLVTPTRHDEDSLFRLVLFPLLPPRLYRHGNTIRSTSHV